MAAYGNDSQWPDQAYAGTRAAAGGHGTQWDIPFSLVADTFLLPWTIARNKENQAHSVSAPTAPAQGK